MSTVEIDDATPDTPTHHALPDPGESVPTLALPTVGIFLAAYILTCQSHPTSPFVAIDYDA